MVRYNYYSLHLCENYNPNSIKFCFEDFETINDLQSGLHKFLRFTNNTMKILPYFNEQFQKQKQKRLLLR